MEKCKVLVLSILIALFGCNSNQNDSNSQSDMLSSSADSANNENLDEVPILIYNGNYCSTLTVLMENGRIIGEYDVEIQVKANSLIWLDLPPELDIDFDTYEPSLINQEGRAEIIMNDGRTYSVQIVECAPSTELDTPESELKSDLENWVEPSLTYSNNKSWAKENFAAYFESGDISRFVDYAETQLRELKTDSEREEATSIINFADGFGSGGIVCISDFDTATSLLGISYTAKRVNTDLTIIGFKFGADYYYFMRNDNPTIGYDYTVHGINGKLTLMKSSRAVACSYLSIFCEGKIAYNMIVQSVKPIDLCLKACY